MKFDMSQIISISPLIVLFLSSLVPITFKAFHGGKEMAPFKVLMWGIYGFVGAWGLTFSAVNSYWKLSSLNFMEVFSRAIIIDGITIWSCYIIFLAVGFCLFLVYDSKALRSQQFSEHIFLILSSAIGMALVVMSNDLIFTFIAIELMSLSTYLLISLNQEKFLSKESAFKYFILGSLSSAVFLYGVAFIYGGAGSTSLHEIGLLSSKLYGSNSLFQIGLVLTIVGFAFKVSLVPFHSWTPDVYQGAATPVTSIMATGGKVASFVAFLRFFIYSEYYNVDSQSLIEFMQWLAILTVLVGHIGAVIQGSFKRMLAYSSVAHSGYVFMALVASSFGGDGDGGVASFMFYLFSYCIMTVGVFSLGVILEKKQGDSLLIEDLKGLGKRSPLLALSFSILLLSLAGLPPSMGFFAKFYVFFATIEQGFYWMTFMGLMGSVIGIYYYLKPIVYMYMSEGQGFEPRSEVVFSRVVLFLSALAVCILGLFSSQIFNYVQLSIATSL